MSLDKWIPVLGISSIAMILIAMLMAMLEQFNFATILLEIAIASAVTMFLCIIVDIILGGSKG